MPKAAPKKAAAREAALKKAASTKAASRKAKVPHARENRISAILEAARSVFEEVGYENARISEIARRIGVVEGTVFHYFSTKKLLMARIIEVFYEDITAELQNGLNGIQGTRNRLRYIFRFHLDVVTRNSRLCGEILRESRALDGELASAVSRLNRGYTKSLSQVVEEGMASGDIQQGVSIPMVRNTVYGSIEHTLWAVINDRLSVDVDVEADRLTALVYQGIASAGAPDTGDVASLIRHLNAVLADRQK